MANFYGAEFVVADIADHGPTVIPPTHVARMKNGKLHMNKKTIKLTTSAAALTAFGLLAAPVASAVTVLTLEPLQFGQGPVISKQLGGSMCSGANVCQAVKYPASLSPSSIPTGAANLNAAINASTGPVIVFAYSEGAQVAGKWMTQYGSGPNSPDPSKVSFVLIGNPNRAYGGIDYKLAQALHISTPADTKYQVTDVARQYDFWADTPSSLKNPMVLMNAIAGSMFIHTDYTKVSLTNPNNVSWKEGNITYMDVPTDILPMYQPLVSFGQTAKALQLTAQNRSTIETGYNRPVAIPVVKSPTPSALAADTTTVKPVSPVSPVKRVNPVKAAVQNLTQKIHEAITTRKANRTAPSVASTADTAKSSAAAKSAGGSAKSTPHTGARRAARTAN